ncbi:hypothetical protein RINTHH_22070 [Richelia intracellularis HH01]|uniref:Uncharacterized protein n=1 Tax=Richelia intracellularis HH01 TaxID=1165094 RepID=M1X0L9_9NOST|nr:hypothetical protein RINTHH_22070 [Richelia intracellularis HH01]
MNRIFLLEDGGSNSNENHGPIILFKLACSISISKYTL